MLTQTNSQEGTIEYEYNSFGEPIKIADNDETKEITYSNFGEVIKEVTNLQTNSYQYDEDGNLIKHSITDKDLEDYVTEYSYNKSGLVTAIKTGMGTETIVYDKAGRIKEKANELTGFSKSYIYYPDNNIREIKTRMNGKLVYYENFAYDKNGNKIYDDQNGEIKKYSYDGLNRLIGAEIGNVRTEYEFDNYNNISREYEIIGANIEKKSYYYDNANRLLLEDGRQTIQYEYDTAGNLTKKITGIGSNAETSYYRYDGYNRLAEYIDNNTTAEYTYNIDGLRESKAVNGIKTRYIYKGADIIGEIFEDNIYTYYRGTELLGYKSNKGDRYYYRQNSHGDVTALLTIDGQEKKTYSYNAYGKENPFILNPMGNQTAILQWKAETEQTHNPFRYCGEYYDAETGLIYLRNRYYDNSIGRFITEDPIRDGLNWYVYCGNNPVMFVDPFGTYYIKDNGDGTYTAKQHKFYQVNGKILITLFIPASIPNNINSKYFNIVGGNHKMEDDTGEYIAKKGIEYVAEAIHKGSKKIFTIIGIGETIKDTCTGMKILENDTIAFGLLQRAGISVTATNKEYLDDIMSKTYGFIDEISYFNENLGEIFRYHTGHSLDYELSQASNPEKIITRYKDRAYSFYCSYGYKADIAMGMANNVESYLNSYKERREEMFDIYSAYMNN